MKKREGEENEQVSNWEDRCENKRIYIYKSSRNVGKEDWEASQ